MTKTFFVHPLKIVPLAQSKWKGFKTCIYLFIGSFLQRQCTRLHPRRWSNMLQTWFDQLAKKKKNFRQRKWLTILCSLPSGSVSKAVTIIY